MKRVIQIVLAIAIIGLAYVLYDQIMTPLDFQKQMKLRETAVIEKIKDIRTAERAYKQAKQAYTANFDELISFLLTDSLVYEKAIGSTDDSVAVAKGLVKIEKFKIAAKDTVFGARKLTVESIKNFAEIPFSQGKKFVINAGDFTTESGVVVPVFECKAPYKDFLTDLNEQELINLIDERKSLSKYPGIKVGAMDQATNDAGNWE